MTTPKIATARLNIQQLEESLAWSRPIPGERPMRQFQAQCHEYLFVRRQLVKWRRHLRRLEREDPRIEFADSAGTWMYHYFMKIVEDDVFDPPVEIMPLVPRHWPR